MKFRDVLAKLDPELPGEPTPPPPPEILRPPSSVVSSSGFLALIEMMREDGAYDFADETLTGIYDSVRASDCVTEAQHRAVLNVRHSKKHWEDDDIGEF